MLLIIFEYVPRDQEQQQTGTSSSSSVVAVQRACLWIEYYQVQWVYRVYQMRGVRWRASNVALILRRRPRQSLQAKSTSTTTTATTATTATTTAAAPAAAVSILHRHQPARLYASLSSGAAPRRSIRELQREAGAVRRLTTQGDGSVKASESRLSSSSFEDDCNAVEECNSLINARLDIPALKARLTELDELVADPKLYDDSRRAGKIVKERAQVEAKLETVVRLGAELQTWREMHEMAVLEGESDLMEECIEKVRHLRKEAEQTRAETLLALGGDLASSNCYLELQAGAGGTESHDWTSMLFKMYSRWADARGFTLRPLNSSPGDEAGLRSVMVFVEGESAYGWLRMEAGVHRLVRNSPYDPTGRRHTSFSQVRLYPEVEKPGGGGGAAAIELPAKELKIDTMRAQGAGGQHVNTTDSAIRITHLPTGLVAVSQSERSQHQNREIAMRALKAKMFQREEEERQAKRNEYASGLGDNAFGNQIRSYVLSPYQMVKDHRTGKQEGDVAAVLDGDIGGFIDAALIAEHMRGAGG